MIDSHNVKPARVRMAPSPTGHFHIGGARTALYNYLFARQTGGQFILRIEDTDLKRNTPEAQAELMEALRWLGIQWDEGPEVGGPHAPYNQTARKQIYLEHARELVARGHAYYCFCAPERLAQVRAEQQARKVSPRYDGLCRALPPAEGAARAAAGEKHVIRFKTPKTGATTVRDYLRGDITVDNSTIDDFILVKSDGFALYHLAAMVDDHLMGITHVFRGSEWLGTFPLHALIIRAFGWEEPVWAHLSVFLKPSGKGKMSKRDVTSEQSIFVLGLRDLGYVPEAINNWIALMGASFGSEERLLTEAELIAGFSLDHLSPSAARVNFEKLDYFNGQYLRQLEAGDLAARVRPFLEQAGLRPDPEVLRQVAPLIRERIVTLDDAVEMAGFFFRSAPRPAAEALLVKGLTAAQCGTSVRLARAAISGLGAAGFTHAALEEALRALAEGLGQKPGQLFSLLRVAVTGQPVSPPLFETMLVIGRDEVLRRLGFAEDQLASAAAA
ncbi:MAG: glutamate--tRNA ligase [Anaerolineales bacterium]|nr:glutamate--tRNA ligase [Anaerolineales bacterium]